MFRILLHRRNNSGVGSVLKRNVSLIRQRPVDSDPAFHADAAQAFLGNKLLAATRRLPRRGLSRPIDNG